MSVRCFSGESGVHSESKAVPRRRKEEMEAGEAQGNRILMWEKPGYGNNQTKQQARGKKDFFVWLWVSSVPLQI